MSENKHGLEDWESKLFEEAQRHTEETSQADLNEFMNKLEDSGYFKKNNKRYLFWLLVAALLVGSLGYLLFKKEQTKASNPTGKSSPIITASPEPKNETVIIISDSIKETPTIKPKRKSIADQPTVKKVTVTKPTLQPLSSPVKKDSVVVDKVKAIKKDSVVQPEPKVTLPEKKKVVKTIIIKSDTTLVSDTTHVKKSPKKKKR